MEKKVLFTASTFSHIQNFHLPYLRYFHNQGWEVHVACGGKEAVLQPYADETIKLPFEKSMGDPDNFVAAALLRDLIKQEKYSLITTHTSLAAFFTRIALFGVKNRPPLVNIVHGYLFDDDTPFFKKQILLTAERLTAPYTDLLLTMNSWDYAAAKRYRLGKCVEKIPGVGVDFSRFQKSDPVQRQTKRLELGFPDDAFVLFYAAEFSKRKSQSVLIQAMKNLPENVFLILAGDGILLEDCKEFARSLGVDHRVLFPGYVENVGSWYGISDAALSASRSEGLPFNIMEAMYCGLPVIASAVKGHEDLIVDGETGLLYPYGDHDACTKQILRLMNSPVLNAKLVKKGLDQIYQYDLTFVHSIVLKKYEVVANCSFS